MATAQQVRPQSKQGQWASIFPNEQVTETQSTLFVKKLLAVAISSLSYLRALFPENAFGDRCLEDVNLKILRDDSQCPEACRVIQWIKGCFDALEKKYLRAVLIGIYEDPEDPDTVIEQYTFKFGYGDGQGMDIYRNGAKISSAKSDKEIKKSTVRLLRTIVLLSQTLSPLPDDVMMTMKLLYYDEVTPEDYNPPGFKECEVDDYSFKEEAINTRVGDVATAFHSFKLRIKTLHHDLQEEDGGEEIDGEDLSAVVPEETVDEQNDEITMYPEQIEDKENQDPAKPEIISEKDETLATVPDSAETAYSGPSNTRQSTPTSSMLPEDTQTQDQIVVRCVCEVNEDDGLMILCAECNTWQHATCFAVLNAEDAPETHYCVHCAQETNNVCTDHYLSTFTDNTELRDLCIWRRALASLPETSRILGPGLAKRIGVSTKEATKLLKRLETEGFVTAGGKAKRFGKLVQKEEITGRGFDKYFRCVEQEQDEDISMVTEKASNLKLTGAKHHSKKEVTDKPKGLKRKSNQVVSAKNKDLRFEISDSQQDSKSSQDMNSRKRRKTSVSVQPMAV